MKYEVEYREGMTALLTRLIETDRLPDGKYDCMAKWNGGEPSFVFVLKERK